MPTSAIAQYTAIGVALVLAMCAIYVIVEMRRTYSAHQLFLRRMEADTLALQKIALQIEVSVGALHNGFTSIAAAMAERQISAIDSLRDYIDVHEQRLSQLLQLAQQSIRVIPIAPQADTGDPPAGDPARLRRETLRVDPRLRFSVLQDWLAVNSLAILRRAAGRWNTVADLIATVPSYLEPEAEILESSILLIGTREHPNRLALAFRPLDTSSSYRKWFEQPGKSNGTQSTPQAPALVSASDAHYEVLAKGTAV